MLYHYNCTAHRKKAKEMNLTVKKTLSLRGKALPPSSKSQSIRGMLFSLLAQGESILLNGLDSDDTEACLRICKVFGASINATAHKLSIKSNGLPLVTCATEINTGNSGITTLFTLPLLGLRENCATPILLNCGEQMRARPIKPLVDALRHLGMHIHYTGQNGQLPVSVTGQLKGGIAEIDGINSQYLSALLIGLPCALNDSVITVRDLHERSYVNMTLKFLQQQGIDYTHHRMGNVDTFHICGNQRYTAIHHTIKGDFSSASCLFAASVLLASEVELHGLDCADAQGDKRLINILQEMGAEIVIEQEKIRIKGNKVLTGIRIDASDIPDLVPALAVIATQARGKTEIYNVMQARIKETDRIHSMTEGLRQMGARIEEHQDGMTVYQSSLQGTLVKGYGDHRTVMALTVAGMVARGTTTITDGEAINKTYPGFVETMQAMGANMTLDKPILNTHIILIGFKHVGKTLIGRQLAKVLNKKFIDLDEEIEKLYETIHLETLTCRQIMLSQGKSCYRELESEALKQVIKLQSCVISLGGGTALSQSNQEIIKPHRLLHVVAPRGIVFERIMVEGRPAFFDPNEDPYESFSRLWDERNEVYKKLTPCTVDNSHTVDRAVGEAIAHVSNPT
jgi:3-phosphoshikimate 1-carboxyvinyltransferase